MSDTASLHALQIESHRGTYDVRFDSDALSHLNADMPEDAHFIIDRRVAELYSDDLRDVLTSDSTLLIEVSENAKSLERFPAYVDHLVTRNIRRNHKLIAIGGGVIQDIAAFLAATLLRGVDWIFYPTTLLAQADSCIGSKSSINSGGIKNILGTFTPPRSVHINTRLCKTLTEVDRRSGVGEMLKAHVIAGPKQFEAIAADYDRIFEDPNVMMDYVRRSLEIKKAFVEKDEFDRGPRLIFNYGHSFGHAIETTTDFAVPHGIAVTIGMDMANFIASRMSLTDKGFFERLHPVLRTNYHGFENHHIPPDDVIAALGKDKKNVGADVTLILPGEDGRLHKHIQAVDKVFRENCREYLEAVRRS